MLKKLQDLFKGRLGLSDLDEQAERKNVEGHDEADAAPAQPPSWLSRLAGAVFDNPTWGQTIGGAAILLILLGIAGAIRVGFLK